MPEGTRLSLYSLVPITRVWPALCPPWKRTTPWAWSVSQSTILPLPSSPHWVPTTTTFFAIVNPRSFFLVQRHHDPAAIPRDQPAVAAGFRPCSFVSRQGGHHHFALSRSEEHT